MREYKRHYDQSVEVFTSAEKLFAYLDDHTRLSSHMNKSSWMMGGGKMETVMDANKGQTLGSQFASPVRPLGLLYIWMKLLSAMSHRFLKYGKP